MKKIVSVLLAVLLTFASAASVFAASTFVDVEGSFAWASPAIEELVEKQIIAVGEDKMYYPENQVTNEQVIAFLGRSLGVNEAENAMAVEYAAAAYESFLAEFETYSAKEAAYLMYKGVFTQNEIKTLLQNKNTGVLRHEMAVYITKLMGGEEEAENKIISTLDYKDLDDIPSSSLGYVEYVRDHNIMRGDDLGNFNPDGIVNRAMMAVMLREIYAQLDRTYFSGQIVDVDLVNNEIITRDEDGFRLTNALTEDTVIMSEGKLATIVDIEVGQSVTFTKSGGSILEVDAFTVEISTSIVEGYFYASAALADGNLGIKIYEDGQTVLETKTYPLASAVKITYNDVAATLDALKRDDTVLLYIENDLVVEITAKAKTKTINNAAILEISPANGTLTIQSEGETNSEEYEVAETAAVFKNDQKTDLSDLYKGDTVNITLTYNKITSITITSQTQKLTGIITGITIGKTPIIQIDADGEQLSYEMASDVEITLEGEVTDIYSVVYLVGYNVDLVLEGQVVAEAHVMETSGTYSVIGTVQDVKAHFKFLKVLNSETGLEEEIFISDAPSLYDMADGTDIKLSDIKTEMRVVVTGALEMGVFKAKTIGIIY